MAENTLPPMADGGVWLHYAGREHYITHEAHIKRLLADGARPITDPRAPQEKPAPEAVPDVSPNEDAYKQRIAELEAMLAAKDEQDPALSDGKPASKRNAK